MQEYHDGYIDFINNNGDVVEIFACLDDVPEDESAQSERNTFENSWNNYLYAISKVKLEYRDKVIPVFHFSESFDDLDRVLNYVHPDTGKHIPYIGLAPRFGNYNVRHEFLTEAFKRIKRSSNPDVKTHAFGCTILRLLEEFPITSADSATWAIASAFGAIRIGDRSFPISDRTQLKGTNVASKSKAMWEEVEKHVIADGLTMDEVIKNPYSRQIMTVRELKRWADNYKCSYNAKVKEELW